MSRGRVTVCMNALTKKTGQRGNRVLIIDDHRFVHAALRKFLEVELDGKPGLKELHRRLLGSSSAEQPGPAFEIDSAYGGKEGWEMVRQSLAAGRPYAVAFVDARMPGAWDGMETLRQIWQCQPGLQVVLCTTCADSSWEAIVQELDDVENMVILRKPFEREEVLQLAYMLARRWQTQTAQRLSERNEPGPSYRFLLLEDDPLTQKLLEGQLRSRLPDVTVLTAGTVAEAQAELMRGHIDFFLLDVLVPDGSGIDFLCELQGDQPASVVVIMTAQALGEYRAAAEELGVLRFMEKPVNMDEIVSLVREQQRSAERLASEGNTDFAASLKQLTTLDIIQLKCLARATTTLEFIHADGEQGRLFFRGGEIIHAETGDKVGEAAFVDIVAWRRGRVEEIADAGVTRQTIDIPWQGLLLNTVHHLDERAHAKKVA